MKKYDPNDFVIDKVFKKLDKIYSKKQKKKSDIDDEIMISDTCEQSQVTEENNYYRIEITV